MGDTLTMYCLPCKEGTNPDPQTCVNDTTSSSRGEGTNPDPRTCVNDTSSSSCITCVIDTTSSPCYCQLHKNACYDLHMTHSMSTDKPRKRGTISVKSTQHGRKMQTSSMPLPSPFMSWSLVQTGSRKDIFW